MHYTGTQKRQCLSHGQNHYHYQNLCYSLQVLPGLYKGGVENASPSVWGRSRGVLPGADGCVHCGVMDDSVPAVPRVTAPVTAALIIAIQPPFVVWHSPQPRPPPLLRCPRRDAFVLWRGRGRLAEGFPGHPQPSLRWEMLPKWILSRSCDRFWW